MKQFLAMAVAASALAVAAPASAQAWQSINQRQANLDARIDAGVRSGDLTRSEATRLRGEFNDLARLEARYRSSHGLSPAERRDLDMRFDRLSAQIRFERNDRQDRGDRGWVSINDRQRMLDMRIDQGRRDNDHGHQAEQGGETQRSRRLRQSLGPEPPEYQYRQTERRRENHGSPDRRADYNCGLSRSLPW